MQRQIIRLTESDLHNIIRKSVNEILQGKRNVMNEDVLGDDWNVKPDEEERNVNNNYEPFEDQIDDEESNDFGITGEKQFDPTVYN